MLFRKTEGNEKRSHARSFNWQRRSFYGEYMLKRISHIKNVGAFYDCQARSVGFEKITLIYGRNTYGKSTLGDIFSSLQKNIPEFVTARASIPKNDDGLLIDMGFAGDGENEGDGRVLFRNGAWENLLRESHLLRVYDESFFHDHVFAARKFTRDTKVKFSDFILGEKGVQTAKAITDNKSEKRKLTQRKNALMRDAFSGIDHLDDFIAMVIPDDVETLKSNRDSLREEFSTLSLQKKEAAKIRDRAEMSYVQCEDSIASDLVESNNLFQASLETHHEEAKAKLEVHISEQFQVNSGAERWLQQGLNLNNGDACGFCGQHLSEDALSLIDIYRECFNDEYDKHERSITQWLDRLQPKLNIRFLERINSVLSQNGIVIQVYPEIRENEGFISSLKRYHVTKTELLSLAGNLDRQLVEFNQIYLEKAQLKKSNPHHAIDAIDISGITENLGRLNMLVESLNSICGEFNTVFSEFKKSINDEDINRRLAEITASGITIARRILRHDKNDACIDYKRVTSELVTLETEIPKLETSLRDEQSAYLDDYFAAINRYFSALGSHEFSLERGFDRSGHAPVYYLKVKFRGHDVSENNLHKVFSESDRRALGLAIFLSSLEAMSDEDLAKTVVVLDDPVTSFDDHRVGQTHMKLMELSERCEQIIILSHFKEGIAHFLRTHAFGNQNNIRLINIAKDDQSSKLEGGDIESFVRSVHEENRENIIDFIERKIDRPTCDLRVFLEIELSYRFGKQIREKDITNENLSQRIDALSSSNIISPDTAIALHRWRDALNPGHHIWLGDDIENQRTTAREFMEFIFHELLPVS